MDGKKLDLSEGWLIGANGDGLTKKPPDGGKCGSVSDRLEWRAGGSRRPEEGHARCWSTKAVNLWSTRNETWDPAPVKHQLFLERILPLTMLLVALVSVPVLIWSPSGLPRLSKLEEEKARVSLSVSRLAEDIRRLRAEVERIKSDPAHVERAARDELGLVRRTEIVFQFDK